MRNTSKQYLYKDIVVITSIILVIDFWSYLPFLNGEIGPIDFVLHTVLILLYLFVLFTSGILRQKDTIGIDRIVLWTIVTIFIGIIPSYIEYNQSVFESIRACLRLTHGLFLYFVLRAWNYSLKRLMTIITIISLIWCFWELFQQVTYPDFWFSGRFFIWNTLDIRMGLYRYYIWGVDFVMIACAYWVYKLFGESRKTDSTPFVVVLSFSLFLMAGILCYCSRKHIYALLLMCVYYVIIKKGKGRLMSIIALSVGFLFLLYFFYDSFAEMDADSKANQGEGTDFIRFIEAKYFLFDFSDSFMYPIWGTGLEAGNSQLNKLLDSLGEIEMYQADIGILGYYSKFGLVGVSAIIWYLVFFFRKWKHISIWMHGFFLMKLLLIVFDFWALWDVGLCAYAVFLYFLRQHLNKKKYILKKQKMSAK